MKLIIDMNLSPEWVAFLVEAGHEGIHWSEVGDQAADDTVILDWARRHGAVVFTNDLDFGRLLALTSARGPSVVQVRNADLLPEAIGADVASALVDQQSALEAGALVVIDSTSRRVRTLPIDTRG